MKRLKVGVVGAGAWGRNHVRTVAGLAEAELAAVCDPDPKVRERMARQYPAALVTGDVGALLGVVDAVIVATPAATHAAIARQVVEAGKPVLVEKPFALTVDDALAVARLGAERKVPVLAGHLLVYHPAVERLRELVQTGELGKVFYLYGLRVNLGQVRKDENALWSFGPHDVSVALYLLGEHPIRVAAHGKSYLQPAIEDVVFLTMEFGSGVLAHVQLSWLDPHKERKLTVVGAKKMVVFDDMEPREKLRIYDKGVDRPPEYGSFGESLAIREGDIFIPRIPSVEPLAAELLDQHPDDPYLDEQYQMDHIKAVPGWAAYNAAVADRHGAQAWAPNGGATLAILDSGLDLTHPEFDGKVVDCATYLTTTGFRGPGCQEANFHGTYVAGIAAAITNNDEGIAGVGFDADLMIYQVCTYLCFTADSAAAMVDAAVRGADVANYSFGGASPSATSERAVEFAHAQGMFQVSSAGNSGRDGADTVTYPAAYDVVMAVGATDRDRKRADFSSIGPEVEVTAPGVGIMSTFTGGLYLDNFSGTSFSGPAVAGLGALLRNLGLDHDEARQVIVDAADPDAIEPDDEDFGRPFEERYGVTAAAPVAVAAPGAGAPAGGAAPAPAGPAGRTPRSRRR